jgi:exopolyphosphatase / guanosine-5'-triphosphate,3'-diphosphate pyrophosphatase
VKRHGVIDIGTNSVKLLVAGEVGVSPRILRERAIITRLGEGLAERGRFAPEAMDRTLRSVAALAAEARRLGVPRPVAIGTDAFRSAANRAEMVRRLRREAGIDLEVLSGRREADLSFSAATSDQPGDGRVGVVDVGGGSTEIAWDEGVRRRRISLPLGAVRLTERHLPTDPIRSEDFQRLIARIRASLASAVRGSGTRLDRVVAVGGTAATVAAMQLGIRTHDPSRIHGLRLTRSQIYVWLIVLSLLTVRQRLALPGLERGRADIIVAGAAVLAGVLGALRVPELTVSVRGLRYGVLMERLRAPEGAP